MRAWRTAALVGAALAALVAAPEPAPAQAALEPGDLLVTALASGRVYCLDPDDPANGCLDPGVADPEPVPTGGSFISPRGLAVDVNGFLLVADNGPMANGSKTLWRADPGADARAIAASMIFTTIPRGAAATSSGRVFVANPDLTTPPTPQILEASFSFGNAGIIALAGSLRFPAAIAVETESPELRLLVADSGENHPVQGRINQGIVRVLPSAFDPSSPSANQQVFCQADVFATPRSLAIDADGTVLLTDSGDGTPAHPPRVFRVPAAGCPDPADPLGEIEIVAQGAPMLRPVGIAVDDAGTIYVADNLADTVFRIVPDANPGLPDPAVALFTPGSVDAWDLQIYRPDPGRTFVADAGARQVLAIDPLGSAPTEAVSFGAGSSVHASLEVLDAATGRTLVADQTAAEILEAQTTPANVLLVNEGARLAAPTSASRETTGTYLVTDLGDATRPPAVLRVDPTLASTADPVVVSEGELLVRPVGGAIDGQGFLIVLDAGSATATPAVPPRILRISPDLALDEEDDQKQLYEGPPLFTPTAIAVDVDGSILVTDAGDAENPAATVRRFFRAALAPGVVSGILLESSGGLLGRPAGVALDGDRSILVADAGSSPVPGANDGAVLRIDPMSGLQSEIPTAGPLDEPTGIGAVPSPAGVFTDTDADHFPDGEDNCVFVFNEDQRDTDSDGYGNVCDPDYDNNALVGVSDLAALARAFGSTNTDPPPSRYDPDIDSDGDGAIGSAEYALFAQCFGGAPGPSAFHPYDPAAPRCP